MPNAILNVGQTGGQVNISTATAPATPAVGVVTLYAGTDKALHALNSDGTDITIAAASAASPITVQQTCSLVSTAIGATAGPGTNCAVVIGNNAVAINSSSNSVVIGNGAKHCTFGSNSVVIGVSAFTDNSGVVSIGNNARGQAQSGIAIGVNACTACNVGLGGISIGCNSIAYGLPDQPDIAIGPGTVSRFGGMAIGSLGTFSCSTRGIAIGIVSRVHTGATGTIVLGNSSVGGTGACNSVVIGNSSSTTGVNSVVIGNAECSSSPNSVLIGGDTNTLTSTGAYNTIINGTGNSITGTGACNFIAGSFSSSTCGSNNSLVGVDTSCINGGSNAGISSSLISCMTSSSRSQIAGSYLVAINGSVGGIGLGSAAGIVCSSGYGGLIGGLSNCVFNSERSLIIGGDDNKIIATSATSAIIGGCSNIISGRTNSVIIGGNNITADANNTVFTPNLKVTGQAASLTNAVGSTGGSVTLNWDNSNIQTLTLTSSITTLTKSNPIDGAVYTLFLTQGGTGGKTVSWGTDVEWPGGTPPTLSTAAGATDAVSLVYIAGVTGYYGNANLNFS
jgi:hypothetical protein